MLFWHKHDLEKAMIDLSNFTPFPDEWTVEDKVLFEQAFQFHGKSFVRIRQMLPDKSIAALVRYYYSWKKTKARSSLMDRQVRRMAAHRTGDDSSSASNTASSNTAVDAADHQAAVAHAQAQASDSDNEDHKNESKEGDTSKSLCQNCGINCSQLQATAKGALCTTCASHLK